MSKKKLIVYGLTINRELINSETLRKYSQNGNLNFYRANVRPYLKIGQAKSMKTHLTKIIENNYKDKLIYEIEVSEFVLKDS